MECDTPGWVQHLQRAAANVHTNVPDTIGNRWPTISEEIQLEVQGITEADWVYFVVMGNWAKTGLEREDFTEPLLDCFMEEHSYDSFRSYHSFHDYDN